jgi:ArsR family transcriptional regulator
MNVTPEALFAALTHPLRLRAVVLLADEDELCVCELTHVLDAAQPTVSRHLAQLRETGMVQDRRQGLWVYYRLHPQLPDWAAAVIRETAAGLGGDTPFAADRESLAAMPNRPGGRCCA